MAAFMARIIIYYLITDQDLIIINIKVLYISEEIGNHSRCNSAKCTVSHIHMIYAYFTSLLVILN